MKIKCKCEICGLEQEREITKMNIEENVMHWYLLESDECEKCGGALWFQANLTEIPRKAIGIIKK